MSLRRINFFIQQKPFPDSTENVFNILLGQIALDIHCKTEIYFYSIELIQ